MENNPMGHLLIAAVVTAFGGFFFVVGYYAFAALARSFGRTLGR
jgi:hypothetical protein